MADKDTTTPKADPKSKPSLPGNPPKSNKVMDEWDARTRAWAEVASRAQASGLRLPGSDGIKIDPKDIKVEVGPPMTEAQFKAWQARRQKALKNFSH